MPRPLFRANIAKTVASYARVNHAGELAAVTIYEAQYEFLRLHLSNSNLEVYPEYLEHVFDLLSQEKRHMGYFDSMLKNLDIGPSIFTGLWKYLSKYLSITSMNISFDKRHSYYIGVMMATQAVEDIIVDHYDGQIKEVQDILRLIGLNQESIAENTNYSDSDNLRVPSKRNLCWSQLDLVQYLRQLKLDLDKFKAEEQQHLQGANDSLDEKVHLTNLEKIWYSLVSYGCIAAIEMSKII